MAPPRTLAALLMGTALVAAACSSDEPVVEPTPESLVVQVASYELIAGRDNRFLAGLLTVDNLFVTAGTADLEFSFLEQPGLVGTATADFLPIPGEEPAHEHAQAGSSEEGRGVYRVDPVRFERAGVWEVRATVDLGDGDVRAGTSAFQVLDQPLVPAPGDRAPRTRNLTLDSRDAPPAAIDSRATSLQDVPDPELHDATIAGAIRAGRPALVVFSTPVYCLSRFCGPITDMVADLGEDYADRAEFIHVEIWRDHQNMVINRAAADWLLREEDLTEPWVFLIGADGRIAARWDNVATRGEIEPFLRELPE